MVLFRKIWLFTVDVPLNIALEAISIGVVGVTWGCWFFDGVKEGIWGAKGFVCDIFLGVGVIWAGGVWIGGFAWTDVVGSWVLWIDPVGTGYLLSDTSRKRVLLFNKNYKIMMIYIFVHISDCDFWNFS